MTNLHLFGSSSNTLRVMMQDSYLIKNYEKIYLYSRNNASEF